MDGQSLTSAIQFFKTLILETNLSMYDIYKTPVILPMIHLVNRITTDYLFKRVKRQNHLAKDCEGSEGTVTANKKNNWNGKKKEKKYKSRLEKKLGKLWRVRL